MHIASPFFQLGSGKGSNTVEAVEFIRGYRRAYVKLCSASISYLTVC